MPEISTAFSPCMYYRKMGSGPAIALIHGFPFTGDAWGQVCGALAATHTVIIPDLPGAGNSVLAQKTSLSMMAEGVKAILDAEKIDKAIIAGHSMGGYIAFAFAGLYPAMVCGLSLVHSTPAADDDAKKQIRQKAIETIQKGGRDAFLKQMISGLFSAGFKQNNVGAVEEQIATSRTISEGALINFYTAMIERPDSAAVLENAPFPVQWITGGEDNVIPMQKILPYCHKSPINFLTFYPECAHVSMAEAPGKLTKDIKEFINFCQMA